MRQNDYSVILEGKSWDKLKGRLLAGVRSAETKSQLGLALENTRKSLLADTMTQNVNYLPKLVLPLVRRCFPQLIANNIISTQTLNGPSGIIRFLDAYVVNTNGERVETDSPFGRGNIYPWASGDVNYSKAPKKHEEWLTGETFAEADNTIPAGSKFNNTASQATPKTFSGVLKGTYSEGTLYLMCAKNDSVSLENGALLENVPNAIAPVATVDRNGVIQQLNLGVKKVIGFVNPKTSEFTVTLTASDVEGASVDYVFFWAYKEDVQKNITFGDNKTINTMEFDIKKLTVDTVTRKLGAKYSFELMEDYQNEFGEKFEDKMVDYLTTTILTEIDGEVIQMLSDKANWSSTWDATLPLTWTKGLNDWYATIMPEINKLSMTIYKKTHIAGASFIVCNPTTAVVFQGMLQYSGKGNPIDGMEVGATNIGTLADSFNVYVSPLCPEGELILGFKGNKPEETGAIYAPYIPIQLQPITYNEGMSAVLARSRYWMGVVRPDYYAKLKVTGLSEADVKQEYTPLPF